MIATGQFTIIDLNDITISQTAPSNPTTNMLWLNTSTKELKMYNGTTWIEATKYTDDSSLTNFINNDYADKVDELETAIDSKITTWYMAGVPTLSNLPASDWTTNVLKNKHLKDLYYDKNTGYAYIFQVSNSVYSWERIEDDDVIEALALANAAKDTADGKRRVFTAQPIPPYDNGDLWINNQEIYICQISKDETGSYAANDFIIATKYTDDTFAEQVNDRLTIVAGTVTTIQESNDNLNIEFVRQQQVFDGLNNKVVGLEGVLEDMSFNFSTRGLSIGTTLDPNNSLLDNTGIRVYNYNKLNAIFNNKGSGIDKLIVTGTAQIGYLKFEKGTKNNESVTKIFHLKQLIEDLEDLEV